MLEPADPGVTQVLLLDLATVMPTRKGFDRARAMPGYVEALGDIPTIALQAGFRKLKRKSKWWPTIAEIRQACAGEHERLKRTVYKLERLQLVVDPPPPRNRPVQEGPLQPKRVLAEPPRGNPRPEVPPAPTRQSMRRLDGLIPDPVRALAKKRQKGEI